MLSVRGLRKSFTSGHGSARAVDALDGVDLDVAEGTFAAVLGASGSGKTTLLRCIAGFEVPDAGTITLAGHVIDSPTTASVRPHARGVGIVPQEGALFPHLSVTQNIAFGLVGASRSDKRTRVADLLALVGMEGLGGRRPHELSGGQQQRVALARALAPEPKLVLLDEPFSALDAKLRVELREEVRSMLRTVRSTVVLVTHDQAEAMVMADHLAVMRHGKVVASGTPREVYDRPIDVELARFLGTATVLPGRVVTIGGDIRVECTLGRLEVRSGGSGNGVCQVMIRPEDLRVVVAPTGSDSPSPTGVVCDVSFLGADALVRVVIASSHDELVVRVAGHERFDVGDTVALEVVRPVRTFPMEGNVDHPPDFTPAG